MPSLTLSQVDHGWLNSETFLWSYFVHRARKIFLCWDPDKVSSGEIPDDPFAKVLVSLAVSSTPVKLAALGLAAFMYMKTFVMLDSSSKRRDLGIKLYKRPAPRNCPQSYIPAASSKRS